MTTAILTTLKMMKFQSILFLNAKAQSGKGARIFPMPPDRTPFYFFASLHLCVN